MKQLLLTLLLVATAQLTRADFQTFQPASVVLGQANFTDFSSGELPNRFTSPEGVAVDPTTGKVFIADSANNRVLRFSSAAAAINGSNPEAVFGQANFSGTSANQGGAAAANTMDFPFGITVDSSGRLWVADSDNSRVLGFFLASFLGNNPPADRVFGQPDFTTITTGITQAKMNDAAGVSVGPDDTLWVADAGNNRVLRFDAITDQSSGANADGVLGQLTFVTNAGATTANGFTAPYSLFADAAGRLWVADTANFRILRFDNAAAKLNGAAADAVIGQPDFTTGTDGLTATNFGSTYGVYFDSASGNLWVSDYDNARVLRFPSALGIAAGGTADVVLGKPNFTTNASVTSQTNFGGPSQIAPGPGGSLLVVDYDFNRVLRFNPVATPTPATATVAVLGKKTIRTSASRVTLRGSATNAASIEYKAGKGGFRPAKGSLSNWKVVLPVEPGRTIFRVRATNAQGTRSRPAKVVIIRE